MHAHDGRVWQNNDQTRERLKREAGRMSKECPRRAPLARPRMHLPAVLYRLLQEKVPDAMGSSFGQDLFVLEKLKNS